MSYPNDSEVRRYQTPGPGPSANVPPPLERDLELSKIERACADIRLSGTGRVGKYMADDNELSKIEEAARKLRKGER